MIPVPLVLCWVISPPYTPTVHCRSCFGKTSATISATTYTTRGSTRDNVGALPSRTASVRQHPIVHHYSLPDSFTVRKDCGPPNRRRSTYTKKRSRKTGSQSFSLDHLATQTMDGASTAVMGSFANDLDHHYGQTCMSPERRYECDGLCREPTRRRSTFEYADVVSWHFDHPLAPSCLLPYFL